MTVSDFKVGVKVRVSKEPYKDLSALAKKAQLPQGTVCVIKKVYPSEQVVDVTTSESTYCLHMGDLELA